MVEDRFGILGKVIAGTYLVEEVIAEGDFGVVYRAEHRGFRVRVALKCLKISADLATDERFLEQLRAETEPLFRLAAASPAVVRPLHVETFPSGGQLVPFIVFEWLEGWTLDVIIAQRVAQGRPPIGLRKLVRMLTPVARALEHAHALPVSAGMAPMIHRDLRPEKLFVAFIGGEQVVKLLDFGFGRLKENTRAPHLGAGERSGATFSPAYGAPEQWAPDRYGATGTWTDVWGLALTLVEAIRGGRIFDGDPPALRRAILDPAQRPTPRRRGVRVSDEVEAIFERALAVDPRTRFLTLRSFWDQLLAALDLDSNGHPKWSRREDPRAESQSSESQRGESQSGAEGHVGGSVEHLGGTAAPRLTGLPPPGSSNLSVDWDALRESQPPPPPRRPLRRRWQPPPALDALEFEPPPRSELPPVLGAAPSSGNIPVVPALEIPGAPPLPGDLDRRDAPASPPRAELDELLLESSLESTAPPPLPPALYPTTSAPPHPSAHPSAHPSGSPIYVSEISAREQVPFRPSSTPPGRATVPPGTPSARPGNVLLEPLDEGESGRAVGSVAPPRAHGVSARPPLGAEPSSFPPSSPPRPGSRHPSGRTLSGRTPSGRTSGPPAAAQRSTVAWGRLAGSGVLLVVAVVIAARNQAHAAASGGESLSWGPLPALWVSLGSFGVAVVLAAASVLGRSE